MENTTATVIIDANQTSGITLFYTKMACILLIAAITIFFGLFPLIFTSFGKNQKLLEMSNAFAGGLFIGISLFHLIYESGENFEIFFSTSEGKESIFANKPIEYFIAFLAYSAILLIERVLLSADSLIAHTKKEENYDLGVPLLIEEEENLISTTKKEGASGKDIKKKSSVTPYILLIALSIHAIFEGTALGLMKEMHTTLFVLVAVVAHKWAESFALGMSFYKANVEKSQMIKMILLFSIFAPIGIVIGEIFTGTSLFIQAIFLAVSGGTFLYISASDVIVDEFSKETFKYQKFTSFICGAILVGVISWLGVK